jgi:hypothetical protein
MVEEKCINCQKEINQEKSICFDCGKELCSFCSEYCYYCLLFGHENRCFHMKCLQKCSIVPKNYCKFHKCC